MHPMATIYGAQALGSEKLRCVCFIHLSVCILASVTLIHCTSPSPQMAAFALQCLNLDGLSIQIPGAGSISDTTSVYSVPILKLLQDKLH